MTRLKDYMRAEQPDQTEPASFYVPGAADWRSAKLRRQQPEEATDEDQITDPIEDQITDPIEDQITDPIEDPIDIQELSESAAALVAAAMKDD